MSQWQPLPPTAAHRWLHRHQHRIEVGLALASACLAALVAWLAVAVRVGWALTPLVAYAVAQIVILHVWLGRARLRVEGQHSGGRGPEEEQ